MPPLCEGRAWFAKGLATDASGQTMDAGAGCGQNRFHSVDSAAYGASPPRDLASNACSAEREFRYLCQKTKNSADFVQTAAKARRITAKARRGTDRGRSAAPFKSGLNARAFLELSADGPRHGPSAARPIWRFRVLGYPKSMKPT